MNPDIVVDQEVEKSSVNLETINANSLPELQGWKEKQEALLLENPFIEISDNATYISAKQNRTALVKGRTEIQGQDKLVGSKIKAFRVKVADASKGLILITVDAETKQQTEVKRYEDAKEIKRQEKAKLEAEEKEKREKIIYDLFIFWENKISNLTLITANEISITEELSDVETTDFEDSVSLWNDKTRILVGLYHEVKQNLQIKEDQRLEKERLELERIKFEDTKKVEAAKRKKEEEKLAEERADFEKEKEKTRLIERKKQDAIDAENKIKQDKIDAETKKLAIEKTRIADLEKDRLLKEQKQKEKLQAVKDKKLAEKKEKARLKRVEDLKPEKEQLQNYINAISLAETDLKLKDAECKKFFNHITSSFELFKAELTESLNGIN